MKLRKNAPADPANPPKKKRAPRKGEGRPPFQPTELQRKQVSAFRAYGMSELNIREIVFDPPIARETFVKHFRKELDLAVAKADIQVVESLHMQAVGAAAVYDANGNLLRAEQPRVPSCGIWWTKARLGWTETNRFQHTGKDGAPLFPVDYTKLSNAELNLLEDLLRKAQTAGDGAGADTSGTGSTRH